MIPFIVRTQWGYTRWSLISFSFFAETSDRIVSGYYQIDTATLSSCFSGKQIIAFIPTDCKDSSFKALTFLNGFEVSSLSPKGTYLTPFEVQVIVNSVSAQGLTLLISTTSATQVHALFISYVAYDPTIPKLSSANLLYSKYLGVATYTQKLAYDASTPGLTFFGLSGFIVANSNSPFALKLTYDASSNSGVAQSGSNFYYLSWSTLSFIGGPCGYCSGFPINFNGTCLATCPPSYNFDGTTCVTCAAGQTWNGKICVTPAAPVTPTNPTNPTNPTVPAGPVITCPIGTYWDGQQLRCLPCLSGCASCVDCYSCSSCALGFYFKQGESLCSEVCGDGKKFVLACDDGNNINGDGCSSTCQVEPGYVCSGGSPSSRDYCSKGIPTSISFVSSGQSHIWGKVIINVKANYLPQALLNSAADCQNKCNNVLSAKIISGDTSAVSILASYIPNTSFSFSIEVNFAKEPIGMFVLQVGINPSLVSKYFQGIDTSSTISVNVNPAYFAKNLNSDNLTR